MGKKGALAAAVPSGNGDAGAAAAPPAAKRKQPTDQPTDSPLGRGGAGFEGRGRQG